MKNPDIINGLIIIPNKGIYAEIELPIVSPAAQ
jgi:hypothetical protein